MPRDPARIEPMLEAIRALWTKYPDLRLGQIVSNAAFKNYDEVTLHYRDVFYIEDDVVFKGLQRRLDIGED